jgi:hypothetical protein
MSDQGPSARPLAYRSGGAKPGVYIGASMGASFLMAWRAAPKSSRIGEPSVRR